MGRGIQLSGKLSKKKCSLADEPLKMVTIALEEEGVDNCDKETGEKNNLALRFRNHNEEDFSYSSNFSPKRDREELIMLLEEKKAKLGKLRKKQMKKKMLKQKSKFKMKARYFSTSKIESKRRRENIKKFTRTEMTPKKSILKKTCSLFKMKSRRRFSKKGSSYNKPPDKKVTFNKELKVFRFREKKPGSICPAGGKYDGFNPSYFQPKYHRRTVSGGQVDV